MQKNSKAFAADISIDGPRTVVAKISTIAVDRDGEVLVPMGCNTKDFEKNPIVFLGHNYYEMPIGKCTGIVREADAITARTEFAERPAEYPEGKEWVPDTILSLFKQGVLKGFSVGFTTIEARGATDADLMKYGSSCRRVFSKWKLLEYSVAPLPANQEAIALAVSKGYCTDTTAKALFGDLPPVPMEVAITPVAEPVKQKTAPKVVSITLDLRDTDQRAAVAETVAKMRGKIYIAL